MLNLTRMERGETWGQGENVTPAVGRLIEALDRERLAIAEAFGLRVKTVLRALLAVVPRAARQRLGDEPGDAPPGPRRLRAEDGRTAAMSSRTFRSASLPTVVLGRLAERPATLHEAGLALFSAAYGRDFAQDNDLLPELGLERLSAGRTAAARARRLLALRFMTACAPQRESDISSTHGGKANATKL